MRLSPRPSDPARRKATRSLLALLLLLAAPLPLFGCAAGAPETPGPTRVPAASEGGLASTLADLAERALEQGDLEAAESRYRRLLASDPHSSHALVGLGQVERARGDDAAARALFLRALAADGGAVEAHLGLADLAQDPAEARRQLEQALAVAPEHPGVHARLARETGRAPRAARSLDDALQLATRHPYDPRALLEAGTRLAGAGRDDEATASFEAVLDVADLDPGAAEDAVAALPAVSARWQGRRVVPVHVFVDAALRARPGWRFRQRLLWRSLSQALDPLLDTRFLVVSLDPLDEAPPGTVLEARLVGLMRRTASDTRPGLFAGFTADPTPRRSGAARGIATYLGRHLVVRDAPDEAGDRVLAHEVLHVYGGIHVLDDLDSLMNPSGDSRRVDPLNMSIVRSLAPRRFGPGGIDRNVLPHVDLPDVSEALSQALRVNLTFRKLGLSELLGDARVVGPGAAARVQEITTTDRHLADVARFAARLRWATGQRVEAVALLEAAARLYGRQTPEGRAAFARAQVLRRRLKAELGVE